MLMSVSSNWYQSQRCWFHSVKSVVVAVTLRFMVSFLGLRAQSSYGVVSTLALRRFCGRRPHTGSDVNASSFRFAFWQGSGRRVGAATTVLTCPGWEKVREVGNEPDRHWRIPFSVNYLRFQLRRNAVVARALLHVAIKSLTATKARLGMLH